MLLLFPPPPPPCPPSTYSESWLEIMELRLLRKPEKMDNMLRLFFLLSDWAWWRDDNWLKGEDRGAKRGGEMRLLWTTKKNAEMDAEGEVHAVVLPPSSWRSSFQRLHLSKWFELCYLELLMSHLTIIDNMLYRWFQISDSRHSFCCLNESFFMHC